MKNLDTYFYDAISESISALGNIEEIVNYYGNPQECTMSNYFAAQISDGKLYDHIEIHDEEFYLCDVEEYENEFEDQLKAAFNDWLERKIDAIDEDDLIDVSESVAHDEEENIEYGNNIPFLSDYESSTEGDDLYKKIFRLMGECSWGQDVKRAAILAGAKYVYSETEDYGLHFWKETEKVATLDFTQVNDLIEEIEGVAWQGWFCEIFAEINSEHEIELSLGSPISNGYTPSSNVVGQLDCWVRKYGENEAEEWASDCMSGTSTDDFDCDECMKYEASQAYATLVENNDLSDVDLTKLNIENCQPETLMDNVILFAKKEGYHKITVTNY